MIYFTVAFPYVVLIALMVNNAMLPGALEGIKYFIIPQWDRLLDVEVSKKEEGKHPSTVLWHFTFSMGIISCQCCQCG